MAGTLTQTLRGFKRDFVSVLGTGNPHQRYWAWHARWEVGESV